MKYFIFGNSHLINQAQATFGKSEVAIYSDDEVLSNSSRNLISYDQASYNKINIDLDRFIPLDSKIIKSMRECEAIFLKMADRFLPHAGYQERKDLYLQYLKIWNNLIDEEFDFAIFHNVPHEGFDYIIYKICELKKIKTFCFYTLPIRPNKKEVYMHMMTDIENPDLEIIKSYHKSQLSDDLNPSIDSKTLNPNTMMEYYDECIQLENNFSQFTRSEGHDTSIIKSTLDLPKKILRYLDQNGYKNIFSRIMIYLKNNFFYDSYFMPHHQFNKAYKRNIITPDYDCKYIFCPLHYQPEASTSPLAGTFVDQWLMIDMLSNTVDSDTKIYLKEHPRQGNIFKSRYFLNNILSRENVFLINYEESSLNLMRNSFAVATATGTVGIEAILNLKPVLMFGNRIYQNGPGVYLIESNLDLKSALSIIDTDLLNAKDVRLFFNALDSHVFPGFLSPKDKHLSSLNLDQVAKSCIEKVFESLETSRDA
ncbi:hypothetical protein N9M61_01395 [Gammaproteobacteria bacterium]|nr:hypothetical protein [Gammaproteobacteria bacterium]MDA8798630.1 hypothetical protein [Gammaproteobacteria bacterium]MDC0919304.1 hypothetical protein [Gammaproteobacteria bacterium]